MKKRIAIVLLVGVIAIALFGCDGATSNVLSGSGSRVFSPGSWTMKGSWNGHVSRDYNLTADNAETISVESTNSGGTLTLQLTQGDYERNVDISDEFNGNIDLSDFEEGKIKIRLNLDGAKNIDLKITWR
ncbi:MAG: hypothetical protein LBI19_01755 [Oscillospiraceae bacterium]|jgi:hypothetical protein|nr:hypothetical protein [Oscillospiraceae bacterium]